MKNLTEKLDLHKLWLNKIEGGVLLDLRYEDLRYEDLRYTNLSGADLSGADLSGADLSGADLRYTNLSGANLSGANLRYADLRYANLRYANLRYANLRYAKLSSADLRYANLSSANLSGVDLSGADLRFIIGNNKEIKSLQIGEYVISYYKNILNIGCQSYTLLEWESFTDIEIAKMDDNALTWWNLNKHIVFNLVKREI